MKLQLEHLLSYQLVSCLGMNESYKESFACFGAMEFLVASTGHEHKEAELTIAGKHVKAVSYLTKL